MDSTWQPAMLKLADGTFAKLREDGEFILYRGRCRSSIDAVPQPALVIAPLREHTAPRSLRRMEHEYSLRAELDPAWAVRPLALSAHQGRSVLVLEDPGGEHGIASRLPAPRGRVLKYVVSAEMDCQEKGWPNSGR
jgi:hypothetical protein